MAVKINELTKVYKTNRGVYDISFEVEKGSVYGLLGPNGAGKTTILKLILGLLSKQSGHIGIDGLSIDEDPVNCRRNVVGMIGDTVLYDYLTPMDHLKMMQVQYGPISEEDMNRVLTDLDLVQYKYEKVRQFSTGMKQRLGFAMCIVKEPAVLLLDEPFSGLDIEGKYIMRQKLCALRDKGDMAIIVSSHQIHDLDEMATQVGIIKNGRLIDEQKVSELSGKYANLEAYFVDKAVQMKEGA